MLVLVLVGVAIGCWGIAYVVYEWASASQRAVVADVVTTICACMRQRSPLPVALDVAGWGRKGKLAQTLYRISDVLEQGGCLSDAVRIGFRRCPSYVLGAIVAGERAGQLPRALESLEAEMLARDRAGKGFLPLQSWWALTTLLFLASMLTGVLLFVVPRFSEILDDMGAELPGITEFPTGACSNSS